MRTDINSRPAVNSGGGHHHYSKLVYWMLGVFGGLWFLLAGAFVQHLSYEQTAAAERLSNLERREAALQQSREDQNRRLEAIERKLEEIREAIRKLY